MTTLATITRPTLTEINDEYQCDTAYLLVKNDPNTLELLFKNLFVVARRFLGFSTRGSSGVFTTTPYSDSLLKASPDSRKRLAWSREGNRIIIEPNSRTPAGKEKTVLVLTTTNIHLLKALRDTQKELDREDRTTITSDMVNSNVVYGMLLVEYWDDMLRFAATHASYDTKWQSLVA